MLDMALHDTKAWDTAVELRAVCKTFRQCQSGDGLLRNLIHPVYRTVHALDGVHLTVRRGELTALAGPNGAGKSTIFKLLCGMIGADAGSVRTCGLDPLRQRIPLMKQAGILLGGRTELWWDHPVITSYRWKQAVWDIPKEDFARRLDFVTDILALRPFLHTFARELSLGQRMRADLGMMLLHGPQLMLLDEPTLGLDVLAKQRIMTCLKELNRSGHTILITSHDLDDLTEMAQRIVMLAQGHVVFDGSQAALRARAGDPRRVIVSCPALPYLPGCMLLESAQGRHTFAYDPQTLPTNQLLQRIGALEQVSDVELTRPPIESVIAGLYRDWK